jgi:hypothetical protein
MAVCLLTGAPVYVDGHGRAVGPTEDDRTRVRVGGSAAAGDAPCPNARATHMYV